MDAVISGRAGTALLKDGNSLFSFDVDDMDRVVPRQQSDLPFLFGDANDLQFLENVDPAQARRQLELAHNNACALDLTLILLDAELSDEVRGEAAAELEALFADTQIIERLEYILYARPLPGTADIIGAIERSRRIEAATLESVLQNLFDCQPFIRQACQEWDAIPATDFGGEGPKAEFQHAAIHEGRFRNKVARHRSYDSALRARKRLKENQEEEREANATNQSSRRSSRLFPNRNRKPST